LPEGGGAGGKSARGEGRKRRGHSAGNAIDAQDVSGKRRDGEEKRERVLIFYLRGLEILHFWEGGLTEKQTCLYQ